MAACLHLNESFKVDQLLIDLLDNSFFVPNHLLRLSLERRARSKLQLSLGLLDLEFPLGVLIACLVRSREEYWILEAKRAFRYKSR